jgi:hypothetical protein
MQSDKVAYDPRAIQDARNRQRWAKTSMECYQRRTAAAPTAIPEAEAKRARKAAKRKDEQIGLMRTEVYG